MTLPDFLTEDHYGYVHLTGHRIGLRHIVELYKDGYTPEMLHDHFPTLPLPLVYKVLAFYLENMDGVDRYILKCREKLDRQEALPPRGPGAAELRRRMEANHPGESA
jgi:uncharacterized protein (DUF433 family)